MEVEKEIVTIKKRLSDLEIISECNSFSLDERAFVKDIITRSYRIHKSALDEFDKLLEKRTFKAYTVQDILSQALWEFADKYKNCK